MKKAQFEGTVKAAFAEESHPLQTRLSFVFTDFQPNSNNQGIHETEADGIIRTGINMPVKVNYTKAGVKGHSGAIPIGPMVDFQKTDTQVVAEAIVWNNEFPEIVDYMKTAQAEDDGVRFSWELFYENSEVDIDGIEWLSGIVVSAATIVANPAYGERTAMLSIAEDRVEEIVDKVVERLRSMNMPEVLHRATSEQDQEEQPAGETEEVSTEEGAASIEIEQIEEEVFSIVDKMYQAIDAMYTALNITYEQAAKDRITNDVDLDSAINSILDRVRSMIQAESAFAEELNSLRAFKHEIEEAEARTVILTERSEKLVNIGIAEIDETFVLSLDDKQFDMFVESMKTMKSAGKKSDAERRTSVPEPVFSQTRTMRDIAQALRDLKNRSL